MSKGGGNSGGHSMGLIGIHWTNNQKKAAARRAGARKDRAKRQTPKILELHAQGQSLSAVALAVGMEPFTVDAIIKRHTE